LWGKLLGGMAGLSIDWLTMAGQVPATAGLIQRYSGLDALETLLKMIEPFAPDATVLLYHLLQIAIWALVSALIGMLAGQKWLHYRFPWSTVLVTSTGVIILAVGHIILASWLIEAAPAQVNYQHLLLAVIFGLVISSLLEITRQYLDLPLPPQTRRRVISVPVMPYQTAAQPAQETAPPGQAKPTPMPLPELPEWEPPKEGNDLILLELD
jgi:hypothetical protein